MKFNYILLGIFCGILLFATKTDASAQAGNSEFSLYYNMTFPSGNTSDYIQKTSFRGLGISFKGYAKPGVAVGIESDWLTLYERKDLATYTKDDYTVSGIQYRYMNFVPIHAVIEYNKEGAGSVNPYAGLGIGTQYSRQTTDMGLYRFESSEWHFSLSPRIGMKVALDESTDFMLGVRYIQAFETKDTESFGYFNIMAGFTFGSY